MTGPLRAVADGVLVELRVTPKSAADRLAGFYRGADGRVALAVRVTAAPDRGKANRAVIEAILKKQGLHHESAQHGEEAVERIAAGLRPDLILMDCQMPVLDGYTAATLIREWERTSGTPRVPIIALTASAFEEDRQKCLASGMDDFLTKPVNVETLKAAIAKWSGANDSPATLPGT